MTRYHINLKGVAAACTAQMDRCPFGGPNDHYQSVEEARAAFEQLSQSQVFAKPLRKTQRTDAPRTHVAGYLSDDRNFGTPNSRLALAVADDTPAEVLDELANDESPAVLAGLLANPKTPYESVEHIFQRSAGGEVFFEEDGDTPVIINMDWLARAAWSELRSRDQKILQLAEDAGLESSRWNFKKLFLAH